MIVPKPKTSAKKQLFWPT